MAKFILGGGDKSRFHEEVAAIVANPSAFLADDLRKDFNEVLNSVRLAGLASKMPRLRARFVIKESDDSLKGAA